MYFVCGFLACTKDRHTLANISTTTQTKRKATVDKLERHKLYSLRETVLYVVLHAIGVPL